MEHYQLVEVMVELVFNYHQHLEVLCQQLDSQVHLVLIGSQPAVAAVFLIMQAVLGIQVLVVDREDHMLVQEMVLDIVHPQLMELVLYKTLVLVVEEEQAVQLIQLEVLAATVVPVS